MPIRAALFLSLFAIAPLASFAQGDATRPPGAWHQYASPERAGWDPEALARARGFAEESGAAAVLLVHRGRVVVAWGEVSRPFKTYSVRKSLVNLLYGMAVEQDGLDLGKTMAQLGIDDIHGLTQAERQATVADLLAARSGVYHTAAREPPDMQARRPARGSHAPGTFWYYNNWDFNALATIYEKEAGMGLLEALGTRLADPLGFEDYGAENSYWIREPSRSRHAAYEFRMSARDLGRVGQLVLQDGRWDGRPVVSSGWLKTSLQPRSPLEGRGGYGYLWWIDAWRDFWRGPALTRLDQVKHVAAVGNGGQMILIVPEAEMVLVTLLERDQHPRAFDSWGFNLADLLLAARPDDAPSSPAPTGPLRAEALPNPPAPEVRRVAQPISRDPADYTGRYEMAPGAFATITHVNGGLFVDAPRRGEAEMFQEAPDRFFLMAAPAILEFERDADGRVVAATLVEGGRRMRAPKQEGER